MALVLTRHGISTLAFLRQILSGNHKEERVTQKTMSLNEAIGQSQAIEDGYSTL